MEQGGPCAGSIPGTAMHHLYNAGKKWLEIDVIDLRLLASERMTVQDIARHLMRYDVEVREKMLALGLLTGEQKKVARSPSPKSR